VPICDESTCPPAAGLYCVRKAGEEVNPPKAKVMHDPLQEKETKKAAEHKEMVRDSFQPLCCRF
jgi:hypothetical protein